MSNELIAKEMPDREALDLYLKECQRLVGILPVSKVESLTVNDIVERVNSELKDGKGNGVDWKFDEDITLQANYPSERITICDISKRKPEFNETTKAVQILFPHELKPDGCF